MPVILTEPENWRLWLTAPAEEALRLQRPLAGGRWASERRRAVDLKGVEARELHLFAGLQPFEMGEALRKVCLR